MPQPIFTPSTKAAVGDHDENIDFDTMVKTVGADLAEQVRDATLRLYAHAREYAAQRGIILADTKFEFGTDADGRLNLEAINPIPVLGPDRLGTAMLNGDVDPATGLLADPEPPFKLYPADLNQITRRGNPLKGLR